MSTPVTTRTGRRVVPTQAAAAAAESKSAASGGGGGSSSGTSAKGDGGNAAGSTQAPAGGAGGAGAGSGRKSIRATRTGTGVNVKVEEKEKPKVETLKTKEVQAQTRVSTRKETRASTAAPASTTPAPAASSSEAPKKRGGLRNTRQSSGESVEDGSGASATTTTPTTASSSGPPAKKAKASVAEPALSKGKAATPAVEKKKPTTTASSEQKDVKDQQKEPASSSPAKVEAPTIAKKSPAKPSSTTPTKATETKDSTEESKQQRESETEPEEDDLTQAMSVDEHGTPVMAAAGTSGVSLEDENDHSDLLKTGGRQSQSVESTNMDTQIIHVESDNHHRAATDLIEAQMAMLHHSEGNLVEHHINQQQQITVLSGQHGDDDDLAAAVISIGAVGQLSADGKVFVTTGVSEESLGMENPPWNEQGCIICNVDLSVEDMANPAVKNHEKMKEFFLEFFSVGDQINMDEEMTFPFCVKCAEDMESLMGINHKIEFMHKQFNKVRDSLAKKAIKTFLVRTKPNCLEEDIKSESYGYMDEEHKKPYKEQMFNLWRSRYELVQPGPKTPVMIRSMDSRGRVTVVRLNSQGQPIPDKFGSLKRFSGADVSTTPGLGGRINQTNGGDNDGDDNGSSLDIYKCNECPKSFNTKIMLAYHSRIHTGELPFECDLCGKAFSVPHYLMTHMRSHTGEKPYKCDECGKGFAQRGGLVTHALVHSGAKPYSCEICGKSFRQKYHLTQHMLIHSGVKPFKCDLCGKDFNVKMNLREHMRRHTGDRPYKCPYCTTIGFFRKKMLKEHISKAHPQRPMPVELMGETESNPNVPSVVRVPAASNNDSSQSADESHEVNEDEMDEEDEEIMDTEMEEAEVMPTHPKVEVQ